MIFPRGQVVYEHLHTSFVRIERMLDELQADLFTGYVQLVANDYEGLLLMRKGGVVDAIEAAQGQRRHGMSMVDGIVARGKEPDAMLNVFRLSPELALLVGDLLDSELVYKDLSTDLAGLDRLVAGLESQRHTGYIEVKLSKSHDTATIFMRDGEVIEITQYFQGSITSGPEVLDELMRLAAMEGALFSVYRATLGLRQAEERLHDGPDAQAQLGLWQEVLKTLEAEVDAVTKAETFLVALKRSCLDLADAYPFLDPFAAEFEYRHGQVRYEGSAPMGEFNQGLSQCLAQCLRGLAAQPGSRNMLKRLAPVVGGIRPQHEQRLAKMGLVEALPELFGE